MSQCCVLTSEHTDPVHFTAVSLSVCLRSSTLNLTVVLFSFRFSVFFIIYFKHQLLKVSGSCYCSNSDRMGIIFRSLLLFPFTLCGCTWNANFLDTDPGKLREIILFSYENLILNNLTKIHKDPLERTRQTVVHYHTCRWHWNLKFTTTVEEH